MFSGSESRAPACAVCGAPETRPFIAVGGYAYWRCDACEATLLDSAHWLSADAERAEYALHRNDVHDPGYRRFLARIADPLTACLSPGSSGLDYGCGPNPGLALMLREAGHEVALFDPYFYADHDVLQRSFDFITCTEVAEHFHCACDQFDRLDSMLRPGGWLGIMTCFQTDDTRFAKWHYRRDPTHVVFYRESTLCYIAEQRGWVCQVPCKNVALMHKPVSVAPTG